MKTFIKAVIVPVALAILIGLILGFNFYKTYKDKLDNNLQSRKLYLLENGEYDSIDKMREANPQNNYVYYKINNKYKTVVAITNIKENIAKIKDLYSDNLKVTEYYIEKDVLDDRQYEYDKLLSKTSDSQELKQYINEIIKLYQNDNSLRLITLS